MEPANMGVFVTPITYVIGFLGLIIVLSMLKGYIVNGVALAITEFLLKAGEDQRLMVCRWFGNGDQILSTLKDIEKNTSGHKT